VEDFHEANHPRVAVSSDGVSGHLMFVRCPQYTNNQSFASFDISFDTLTHPDDRSYLNANGEAHGHRNS
jgi:hypothetical protein